MILLRPKRPQVGNVTFETTQRRLAVVERQRRRRLRGQLLNEHTKPPRREIAAVEIEQVELIETQKVGLDSVAVLVEQATEAN